MNSEEHEIELYNNIGLVIATKIKFISEPRIISNIAATLFQCINRSSLTKEGKITITELIFENMIKDLKNAPDNSQKTSN